MNSVIIKDIASNSYTYNFDSKTFKRYIYDSRLVNNISSIEYDIKHIDNDQIEDVLYFCLHNKIKVILKKDLELNKLPDILLECFDVNEINKTILQLSPKKESEYLKKNVSIAIISYNNLTFLEKMINQVLKYTNDIVIIDNKSTYQPLLDFFKTNENKYTILNMEKNHGHTVYKIDTVKKILGPLYLLTDPDIELPSTLPKNFVRQFYDLTKKYKIHKIGVALDIFSDNIRTDVKALGFHGVWNTIKDWEKQFWKKRIEDKDFELYSGDVDTTFCFVNEPNTIYKNLPIRIAGVDYTSKHLPWYKNWESQLRDNEYNEYMKGNISTNWCVKN
jgi:hypothetical protein